jgi:hypothetical protein
MGSVGSGRGAEALRFTAMNNGRIDSKIASKLYFTLAGCAHRGTTVCHRCPFAEMVRRTCGYVCGKCGTWEGCPCGQPGGIDDLVDLILGEVGSDGY